VLERLRRPAVRVRLAATAVLVSLIGWPVTALTVARDEPQFVLGLSWAAIILTSLDVLATSDVRREQTDNAPAGD
jgi:uncharacterized membrane protein YfcA